MPGAMAVVELQPPEGPASRGLRAREPLFRELAARVSGDGSVWLLARTAYRRGQLVPWPFLAAERLRARGFRLRNVVVRFDDALPDEGKALAAAHGYALLLVRSVAAHRFDKGPFREPYVYKDLEWGRRVRGPSGYHPATPSVRYPSEGRDPGNVLYRDLRGPAAELLDTRPVPDAELLPKLVRATSAPGWTVLTNLHDPAFARAVRAERRSLARLEAA
jgi:hypothetical protein